MFPINYRDFYDKFADLFLYQKAGMVMLEKLALARFFRSSYRYEHTGGIDRQIVYEKMLIMSEREPVHSHIDSRGSWVRKMYWPKIGLITHHDPEPKKKILKKLGINSGKNIKKLLESKDLSYFNDGIKKMRHNSN